MIGALELHGQTLAELEALVAEWGYPSFRAKQLFAWLHRGAAFEAMHTLPAGLRERLQAQATDRPAEVLETRRSALDGTIKLLYRLRDNHVVEGVLMRYRHGVTLCLSTQVGCAMGCAFCASTLDGKARDLTAAEMIGQVLCANTVLESGEAVHNVVLMGSGEPLENYGHTVNFLRLLREPDGLNIGLRHVSLSTCGLVPQMTRLAEEGLPVTLSVSLHAPNDTIRQTIMPVARAYPMNDLIDACRYYVSKTGRRVVFEYALMRGINEKPEHARELAGWLRGLQCHVNLIPLNIVEGRDFYAAGPQEIRAFQAQLEQLHISVTQRREMGADIQGACGQLRRAFISGKTKEG
ncbi:MAG: 23S rRNA (adenine(2503)-C(2))-methyltransferase RlmN [Clostridia bacterium]|nr:23S rRNA (adenine(2503)-C(2))-methyltransferase RlmN [Clostridia bacterium]